MYVTDVQRIKGSNLAPKVPRQQLACFNLLFGIRPTDPLSFTLAVGTMVVVALLAGYLPARRASRTDPMVALRYE